MSEEKFLYPRSIARGIWLPESVMRLTEISASAKLLLMTLHWMCGSKCYCWPSQTLLADRIGVTSRTVKNLVRELAERDFIRVKRIAKNHRNRYYMLLHAAFQVKFEMVDTTDLEPVEGEEIFPSDVYGKTFPLDGLGETDFPFKGKQTSPPYKECSEREIELETVTPPSPQPPSQGKGELEDSLLHATKSKAPELGSAGIDSVTTTRLTSDCASEIIRCTIGRGSLSKQAIRLIDDFDWSTWDEDQLRSETTRLADYKPEQFMASVAGAPVKRSASFRGGRMSRSSQPKQSRYGAKTQPSVDLGGAVAWSEWFKDAAKHAQPLMDAELPLLAECLQDKDFRNNSQKLLEALDACASSDSEWKPTLSWAVRGNPKNWTRVVAGEFAPKKISRKSKDFDVVDSAKDLVKRMREKGRL